MTRLLERKSAQLFDTFDFACELKLASDGILSGAIEGYASVFGITDLGGDIAMPGAFKASLANWRQKGSLPVMLRDHDQSSVVGVWTDIAEDGKGLRVKGQLTLGVPLADQTRLLIQAGAMKGLSIGYKTIKASIDKASGARKLEIVDLWEISLVAIPMLPEAQVTSVKSAFDPKAWETAFRDGGLSISEAKLATSIARKMALRDAGASEPPPRDGAVDVLMSLRKAAAALR